MLLALLFSLATASTNVVIEKNTFESDMDGWKVEGDSWLRRPISWARSKFPTLPPPPDASSTVT